MINLEPLAGLLEAVRKLWMTKERIFFQIMNQGILECPRDIGRNWKGPRSSHPDKVEDPCYTLGAHPDLVEKLWDKLTSRIGMDCRWVLHARPVLVHPETGVIFAFATGTHMYAFRVPAQLREEAGVTQATQEYHYSDGSVLDLKQYDADWIFGGNIDNEVELCLKAFRDV